MSDLVRDVLFCLRCLRHPGKDPLVFIGTVFILLMGAFTGVAAAGSIMVSEGV